MKQTILTTLILLIISCNQVSKKKENQTEQSVKGEWISLFDGKSFDGWHQFNKNKMSTAWEIVDGVMVFDPNKKNENESHDLVTDNEYTNFELSLEWNIAEGGNSGIFWAVKKEMNIGNLTPLVLKFKCWIMKDILMHLPIKISPSWCTL